MDFRKANQTRVLSMFACVLGVLGLGAALYSVVEVRRLADTREDFLVPTSSTKWAGLVVSVLPSWNFKKSDDEIALYAKGRPTVWVKLNTAQSGPSWSIFGTPQFAEKVRNSERLSRATEIFVTATLKGNRIVYAWNYTDDSALLYGYLMTPSKTYLLTCKQPKTTQPRWAEYALECWTVVSAIEERMTIDRENVAMNSNPIDRPSHSIFAGPLPIQRR